MRIRINYTDGEYETIDIDAVEPNVQDIVSALLMVSSAQQEMDEHYTVESIETVG